MAPHMTNRLGEILVHKGFITPEQLCSAIKEQKKYRQRLAYTHQIARLKKQPTMLTLACSHEILRAHRENSHCVSLQHVFVTHREAANDSHYDQE